MKRKITSKDPEIASLESRIGLCNALAVALTQSLVWLHTDEVNRIALTLNTLAKLDLLVFGEFMGHRAYFELLRKSTELVFDDEGTGLACYVTYDAPHICKSFIFHEILEVVEVI